MKDTLEKLQMDLKVQAKDAESNPDQAIKIFGVDQLTKEQRKVALHKTSLVRYLRDVSTLTWAQRSIGSIGHYERGTARSPST